MAGKKKGAYASQGSGTTVTVELDLYVAESLLNALNTAIYGGGGKKKKKKGKKSKGKGKPKGQTTGGGGGKKGKGK